MIAAGLHQVSSETVLADGRVRMSEALVRALYGYNTARRESALPYSYPRFWQSKYESKVSFPLPSVTRLFAAARIGAIPKYQYQVE